MLGTVAPCLGDYDLAATFMGGYLALVRKRGQRLALINALPGLAYVELRRQDYARAATHIAEAVTLSIELVSRPFLAHILAHVVSLGGTNSGVAGDRFLLEAATSPPERQPARA
jgi:hypothetical protein